MTRHRHMHSAVALLLAAALFFPAFSASGKDGGEGAAAARALVKGPYLQNLSADGVTICWETDEPTNATVFYGKGGSIGSSVSDGNLSRFHGLAVSGLEPNTTFDYQVLSNSTVSASSRFRTAPAGRAPFSFAVYGDCRTGHENHTDVIRVMRSTGPSFYLCTGDLVDSGASVPDWQTFFGIISPFANDTPYWPSIGNHDTPNRNYLGYFSLPGNERWYSFDYGTAHFVALDTTDDITAGSAQNDWLRSDLERAGATAEWKFVFFHYPPYSSALGHGSNLTVREALDPIFVQYGVDAAFSGHDHDYEHADPGNGVQYFVTGGGGAPLGPSGRSDFTVYSETAFHFLSVALNADGRHATVTATREDGSVMETVRLAHVPRPPAPPADFRVTANTTTSVTLSWKPPSDPYLAGYGVLIADNGSFQRNLTLGPVVSYTFDNLTPGREFSLSFRALYDDPMQSPAAYNSTPVVVSGRTADFVRHPPSVSITAPSPGQSFDYGRPVNCSARIVDGGAGDIPPIEWRLDGVLLTGTDANISLGSVTVGNHSLNVRATDRMGDSGEASVTFMVREKPRPPPEPAVRTGGGPMTAILLGAVLGIILLAGAAIFLAGRNRRRSV